MAALRSVEERDAKGNTIRVNPAVTFKQDRQIRKVVGRHDFHMIDNAEYHPPITAQVQNGKIVFFDGVPDSTNTRNAAKEIPMSEVPEYIIANLKRNPMRVREPRPTVFEVKIATMGDVEVAEVTEIENNGESVTIEPIAPNVAPRNTKSGKPSPEATM